MSYMDINIDEDAIASAMAEFRNGSPATNSPAGEYDPSQPESARNNPLTPMTQAQRDALNEQERIAAEQGRVEQADTYTPEPPSEPPPPDEPPPPASYLVDGREVPYEVIKSMVSFDDFLRANPAAAESLRRALSPEYETIPRGQSQSFAPSPSAAISQSAPMPQATQSANIPADIDMDDPTNRYMVDQFNSMREENAAFRAFVENQNQVAASNAMTNGIDRFVDKYNNILSPQDIDNIRNAAVPIYPSFVQKHNGAVEPATYDVLEYTMWSLPPIREKLFQAQNVVAQQQEAADVERQRRLSALSGRGSSGNASPIPEPETPSTSRLAMVRAIREAAMGESA